MHITSLNLLLAVAIVFFSAKGCTAKPGIGAIAASARVASKRHPTHNEQLQASDNNTICETPDMLPEKFFGGFKLDHSENLDEYLTAKGYSWFTRKMVTLANFKKVFAKTEISNTFDYPNLTSKKDVFHKNVCLGNSFSGEGIDSTKHEITFSLNNGHLFEHHKPLEEGEAKEETYEYYFDGDWLLQKMSYNGVEGRRYYKKTHME
ncbi:unnamed protein product [Caenorhabditis nigoni]